MAANLLSLSAVPSRDRLPPRRPWGLMIGMGVLLLGLLFRLYLPTLVKNYSNRVLERLPGYRGHIQDVQIHLWRGAYSVSDLDVVKTGGGIPVPFFSAPHIDFSIHWDALVRGQLAGKLKIDHPRLNFVAGDSSDNTQLSMGKTWRQQAKALLPLRISRMEINDGEIHFRNYQAAPPVDIFIHQLTAVAFNLTNSRKMSKTLKATLNAQGLAMADGKFIFHLEIDPLVEKPDFVFKTELEGLTLPQLNDFFSHYLAVTVKTGTFSFYAEGASQEGDFKGYAKPLFDHLDFIRIKENPSVGEFAKALVVKMVSYTMKNHAKDRLATRVEMAGTVENPEGNVWTAVASFLGNWLIRAIAPGLEGIVSK